MIIQSENSRKRKIFEIVTTALGWLFLISFLLMLGSNLKWKISGKIYSLALVNSNTIILFTVVIIVISFIGLSIWGIYNKKRFGNLDRRSFPIATEIEDIADYYSLSSSEVLQLQQEKFVQR
jgi:poly-beta-1,6-N-acetyl-D-glucosamine biosynthesis protein PgaD